MEEVDTEIGLCNFYIFNPTYGTKEGEVNFRWLKICSCYDGIKYCFYERIR